MAVFFMTSMLCDAYVRTRLLAEVRRLTAGMARVQITSMVGRVRLPPTPLANKDSNRPWFAVFSVSHSVSWWFRRLQAMFTRGGIRVQSAQGTHNQAQVQGATRFHERFDDMNFYNGLQDLDCQVECYPQFVLGFIVVDLFTLMCFCTLVRFRMRQSQGTTYIPTYTSATSKASDNRQEHEHNEVCFIL